MKAGMECKKSESGFHCWHRRGWSSNPDDDNEQCCHCGKHKAHPQRPQHGPYAPHKWRPSYAGYGSLYDEGWRLP